MNNENEENEGKEERGFTVVDRRGEEEAPSPPSPEAPSGDLPKIDFSTFVLSLSTSALYHMGVVADPESGTPTSEANLPLARQTIDTLEMLSAKTRGNLDSDEAHLLESLLYELRMRFVEAAR